MKGAKKMPERIVRLYLSETITNCSNEHESEDFSISFEFNEDQYDIYKVHDYCKRFALVLGFSET